MILKIGWKVGLVWVNMDEIYTHMCRKPLSLFGTGYTFRYLVLYTHANKKRPPQFISFFENKYTHEHVMIINLYIANHILYECILWGFYACLKEAWDFIPPLVKFIAIVQPASVQMWQIEREKTIYRQPRISQGWPIGDGLGPGRPVKGVWLNQLANSTLPWCRYTGIVLMEDKMFPTV